MRNLARLRLGFSHVQNIACFGCSVQTKHFHRHRRARLFDTFTLVVDERAHLAVLFAHDKDISLSQSTILNKSGGDRTATDIKLRFDYGTLCCAVRIGFQLKDLGLQRNRFKQFVQTLAGYRRDLNVLHVTRKLLNNHLLLQQIRANLVGIRARLINLVDCNDHWHVCGFGVIDCLNGLGHHSIIRSNHQHNHIRHLRAARAHRSERRVARGVEE